MNRKLLIAVAATAFLCGLVMQAPATWITRLIGSQSGIEIYGAQGTLTNGRMDALVVNGRPALQNLRWTFKPLWLLLAQRALDVSAEAEGSSVQMQMHLSPFGNLTLNRLQAQVALARVLALSGQTYLPVDGQLQLDVEQAQVKAGHLLELTGAGQLRGLRWTLSNPVIALGDFDAQAASADGKTQIQLSSPSGPVDAQGQVQLSADGHYQIDLQYRARAQAEPVLRNLIAQAGTPDTQGWVHYRSQGQF